MPDDLDKKVEEVSKQKGMTKTALINMVMSDYIGNYEDPSFFTEIRKRIEKIEKELEKVKK